MIPSYSSKPNKTNASIHTEAPQKEKRVFSIHRVGPHSKDILDFMFGALLGDGNARLRHNAASFYFVHYASQKNYLFWKQSMPVLCNLIQEFVHVSMLYKISSFLKISIRNT